MVLIDAYKDQINTLCKKHQVKSLYSFGSVNTPRFSSESDVDFMVDFAINDPVEYAENYFDLKFELERILNRPIDLLENKAIKNQFLRDNKYQSKVLIYGQ
jgi:uncharacterized protein